MATASSMTRRRVVVSLAGAAGTLLLSWPVISGRASMLDPSVFVWMFGGWSLVIAVAIGFLERGGQPPADEGRPR